MIDEAPTTALAVPLPAHLGAPVAEEPIFASAKRLLRGRMRVALILGAALAAVGALAGSLLPKPLYRSVGLIDVAPKLPRILYESDEKGLLPMFDEFVASQAAQASTRRVVDMAMASPEWKKFGRGAADADVAKFQENLAVTHPKFTEHVEVAFTDENPEAAETAVDQVINAYMKTVDERDVVSGQSTRKVLENQRALAGSRLSELRADVLNVTEDLGEQSLDARYQFDINERNKLDASIQDLDVEIALAKAARTASPAAPDHVLTENEIAVKDPGMERLVTEKSDLESRLAYATDHEGFGSQHPDVVTMKEQLALVNARIVQRAQAWRGASVGGPDAVREKEARRASLAELRESVQTDTKSLGKKRLALANIEQERSLQTERLEEIKKRLAQIDVESELSGRIRVVAFGDRPVETYTDRRVALGILGGVGGFLLGFCIVMLWGFCEAKVRHFGDVDARVLRGGFLGVVPDVTQPWEGDGVAPAATGDFCVHHVRTMLQIRAVRGPQVVAVTSPSPAAGKTTLTLALGMSYAATGVRTLIVDLDFTGRGMTSALRPSGRSDAVSGAEPPPVGLLAGIVRASRAHAADESRPPRPRAVGAEQSVRDGVIGALAGRPLEECVVDTGVPGLSSLPAEGATARDAERLSRMAVRRLVEQCRGFYDCVLIDTGPVLGSIETSIVADACDDVLLVVSRGERRARIQESLERLRDVSGGVAGIVFNRANTADVASSRFASRPQSDAAEAA